MCLASLVIVVVVRDAILGLIAGRVAGSAASVELRRLARLKRRGTPIRLAPLGPATESTAWVNAPALAAFVGTLVTLIERVNQTWSKSRPNLRDCASDSR